MGTREVAKAAPSLAPASPPADPVVGRGSEAGMGLAYYAKGPGLGTGIRKVVDDLVWHRVEVHIPANPDLGRRALRVVVAHTEVSVLDGQDEVQLARTVY
jgi:hypothetical protein